MTEATNADTTVVTAPITPANTVAEIVTGKGEEGKATDGKAAEKAGAPEAYKAFTLPEGVVVDEALVAQFQPLAKEMGLTQEQAQKLVDIQTRELAKGAESQTKAWAEINEKWVEAAKSDKEYGGAKFGENIAVAKKALDAFGTPELREALEITGAGNHPEFLRFMYRVGKTLKEDTVMTGKPTPASKSHAAILFPNQN